MAQTIPVWINTDTITSGSLSDGSETTAAAVTTASGAISAGLIAGVHGKLSSTGGQVTVRAYSDASKTSELYSVTLDFSGGSVQASQRLNNSGIPFFEALYFTAEGDSTSASKTINLTFYISALRY